MPGTITISPLRGERKSTMRASRLVPSMIRRLLFAFVLLLTAHSSLLTASASAGNWTRQPTGTMAWLHGIYFLDQSRGWIAGSNGTLLETTDGGQTWRKLDALTRDNLRDVYFANEKVGWLVAERDVLKLKTNDEPRTYLLKTQDGGSSWQRVFLNGTDVNARLVRVVFADSQRGWVFGESGIVFATRDGGVQWMRQPAPTRHLLLGGTFVDYAHGWLVGAGATILQTNDGGLSWQSGVVRDGAGARFTATSFAGNSLGWAVGTAGLIFATTDGGRTWSEQHSNIDTDLFDVKFVDTSEGWAVGSQGTLLGTKDGGRHWLATSSGTSHALDRLFFVDPDHGWAVGFGGTLLSYGPLSAPRLKT